MIIHSIGEPKLLDHEFQAGTQTRIARRHQFLETSHVNCEEPTHSHDTQISTNTMIGGDIYSVLFFFCRLAFVCIMWVNSLCPLPGCHQGLPCLVAKNNNNLFSKRKNIKLVGASGPSIDFNIGDRVVGVHSTADVATKLWFLLWTYAGIPILYYWGRKFEFDCGYIIIVRPIFLFPKMQSLEF